MQMFSPTEDELELATRILVSRGCASSSDGNSNSNSTGGGRLLQGDQAKEVFNRSGLAFATLRVIWNMSSENGNGVLEKYEIAKALRLIGWVQAGEMLSEKLLSIVGPLPTLDGITNDVEFKTTSSSTTRNLKGGGGSPQIMVFPAVDQDQVRECKAVFWEAGPVNGFLTEDKIMSAYMMTSDLSYEDIRDIINLIDRGKRRVVDFPEFACGLYLVKALQDSQLHSLPCTIPPDIFEQFMSGDPNLSNNTTSTTGSGLSLPVPPPPPTYRRQLSSSLSPPSPPPPLLSSPSTSTSTSSTTRHRQSYFALSPQQPSLRLSKPRMSTPPSPNHPSPSSSSSTTTTTTVTDVQTNNENWEEISQHDRNMFELYFRKLDGSNMGYLDREAFDEFVSVYRVPITDLDRIWELTALDRDGFMKRDQFTIAMHLVKQRSSGREIPTSIPPLSILSPSLKSRRNTISFSSPSSSSSSSSLTAKLSIKKPPPPVPPKRRDSIMKATTTTTTPNKSLSLSVSPPISPRPNPFRQTMSFSAGSLARRSHVSSSSSSSSPPPPAKSPFDDDHSHLNGIPRPRSPPLQPLLPLPPPPPPPPPTILPTPSSPPPPPTIVAVANHEREPEALTRSRDEISRLSRQIEVLLTQLEAQTELRATNEALRLENDILKTQGKDMERMMADILAVNESESAGSLEKHSQDITRYVRELGEKETQCEEQERRLRVLAEDEKALRVRVREMESAIAKSVADAVDLKQTIEVQRQEIKELNSRVGDMSKALADEPVGGNGNNNNGRGGGGGGGGGGNNNNMANNREMRVLIRDVTRENDALKSEVRDMHRSMEQLLLSTKHAKYDEMELENRKLKKTVGGLEMMVNQLQTSVGVGDNNGGGGGVVGEGLVRENEKLKAQLQDGKRQFTDFRSTSETRMVDLQQKVEELTRENNRLKMDIHEGRNEREDGSVPPPAYDDSFVPPA